MTFRLLRPEDIEYMADAFSIAWAPVSHPQMIRFHFEHKIDDLNKQITLAKDVAEVLEKKDRGGYQTRKAYRRLCLLQARLAMFLPANTQEGAAARQGAIRAASLGGDLDQAMVFLEHYMMQDMADDAKAQLKEPASR